MKELETHIQQMAEKTYPYEDEEVWANDTIDSQREGYFQGIKDADAVGFYNWWLKKGFELHASAPKDLTGEESVFIELSETTEDVVAGNNLVTVKARECQVVDAKSSPKRLP